MENAEGILTLTCIVESNVRSTATDDDDDDVDVQQCICQGRPGRRHCCQCTIQSTAGSADTTVLT